MYWRPRRSSQAVAMNRAKGSRQVRSEKPEREEKMREIMISKENEALIQSYLDIVASDDYRDFDRLITDDCTFSLMPIGYTFRGREEVVAFVETAGSIRKHDQQSQVAISNQFTDGEYFCVEYEHAFIIKPLGVKSKVDGYCLVFHFRDGKFDAVREYINPSRLVWVFFTLIILRLFPFIARRKLRQKRVIPPPPRRRQGLLF